MGGYDRAEHRHAGPARFASLGPPITSPRRGGDPRCRSVLFARLLCSARGRETRLAADLCAVREKLPPRRSLPATAGGAGVQAETDGLAVVAPACCASGEAFPDGLSPRPRRAWTLWPLNPLVQAQICDTRSNLTDQVENTHRAFRNDTQVELNLSRSSVRFASRLGLRSSACRVPGEGAPSALTTSVERISAATLWARVSRSEGYVLCSLAACFLTRTGPCCARVRVTAPFDVGSRVNQLSRIQFKRIN